MTTHRSLSFQSIVANSIMSLLKRDDPVTIESINKETGYPFGETTIFRALEIMKNGGRAEHDKDAVNWTLTEEGKKWWLGPLRDCVKNNYLDVELKPVEWVESQPE